jgi:glycosyltransferase involved in cell wall biosynthesis
MRVLMLVATPVITDARVLREAQALVEAGHQVHVVGKDVPAGTQPPPGITLSSAPGGNGLRHGRAGGPPSAVPRRWRAARWLLLPEHRALTFANWAAGAARLSADLHYDVVHAHDFTALRLGWRLAARRRVPLVYDAHELWAERRRSGRPTPVERWRERRVEGRLGRRAAVVLTVGEALAARLRSGYGWEHVAVVRNTFPAVATRSAEAPPRPAAVLYAGRLGDGRDLETVAAASSFLRLPVRLVGPADPAWSGGFDPGRCDVRPAVGVSEVDAELRSAGLALVTLEPGCGNHEIALPNKLFQAVSAGVPVVATDVGELARTVRDHGVGVLYRAGEAGSLAAAVEEAVERYPDLVKAVERARWELSWDRDRTSLLQAYAGLVP